MGDASSWQRNSMPRKFLTCGTGVPATIAEWVQLTEDWLVMLGPLGIGKCLTGEVSTKVVHRYSPVCVLIHFCHQLQEPWTCQGSWNLLKAVKVDGCCSGIMRCFVYATLVWEAVPSEPSMSTLCNSDLAEGEDIAPSVTVGISLGSFPSEQMCDEFLRHMFDQVKTIHVQIIQKSLRSILTFQQSVISYETRTQIKRPFSCWCLLFHMVHYNPMVGHLGQDKTLTNLMGHFDGWAFVVIYAGGVDHPSNVSWWICQPHWKPYFSWHEP